MSESALATWLASTCGVDAEKAWATVKATCFGRQQPTNEQCIAFLHVCQVHGLDPFLKEVHALVTQAGGVQPIVGYDGWAKLANTHPAFDGATFSDALKDGVVVSVTCTLYRKDRSHPISCTEYLSECRRDTIPWKQWPARMLRNKAFIQAARLAFGFAGIIDPDEAERILEAERGARGARARFLGDPPASLPAPTITEVECHEATPAPHAGEIHE